MIVGNLITWTSDFNGCDLPASGARDPHSHLLGNRITVFTVEGERGAFRDGHCSVFGYPASVTVEYSLAVTTEGRERAQPGTLARGRLIQVLRQPLDLRL